MWPWLFLSDASSLFLFASLQLLDQSFPPVLHALWSLYPTQGEKGLFLSSGSQAGNPWPTAQVLLLQGEQFSFHLLPWTSAKNPGGLFPCKKSDAVNSKWSCWKHINLPICLQIEVNYPGFPLGPWNTGFQKMLLLRQIIWEQEGEGKRVAWLDHFDPKNWYIKAKMD